MHTMMAISDASDAVQLMIGMVEEAQTKHLLDAAEILPVLSRKERTWGENFGLVTPAN